MAKKLLEVRGKKIGTLIPTASQKPIVDAHALLLEVVAAWEALPGGRYVRHKEVEQWLVNDMSPAINKVRDQLGLPYPPFRAIPEKE